MDKVFHKKEKRGGPHRQQLTGLHFGLQKPLEKMCSEKLLSGFVPTQINTAISFFLKHFTFLFALKDQKVVEIREKSDTQF